MKFLMPFVNYLWADMSVFYFQGDLVRDVKNLMLTLERVKYLRREFWPIYSFQKVFHFILSLECYYSIALRAVFDEGEWILLSCTDKVFKWLSPLSTRKMKRMSKSHDQVICKVREILIFSLLRFPELYCPWLFLHSCLP